MQERETERSSNHNNLESKSIVELTAAINSEDAQVAAAVAKVLPQVNSLLGVIVEKMKLGGRLFYIGAGTSGRLGILDASECPPTFGVSNETVIGLIAGGDKAIRQAVEGAEDSLNQGWEDLQKHNISSADVLIGIAASGRTPYVIGALQQCNANNIATGCIVCTSHSEVAKNAKHPVEVIVGPEFVTGSTRMKAGTAQKMVLNIISTTAMIQLGKVKGNKMVDMQLSNAKLVARGIKMIMDESAVNMDVAAAQLEKYGNVRMAIEAIKKGDI